jgi:hypothetical protein
MSSVFRRSSPADAGAISSLMQQVFGMRADHPAFHPEQMDWKYWRDHPEWDGSRGFVVERDGAILAHGSVIPLQCAWAGRRIKVVELIDWVAQPKATGAGITLLKKVAETAGGMFIAGGTEMTQKILPSLGFRESARATRFALPLRPLARLRAESVSSWKPLARFARNTLWKTRAAATPAPGWDTRRILSSDLANLQFPTPHATARIAVFERTAPGLAYFLECPVTPAEFHLVEEHGVMRGYFILTMAFAQCRIADAWVETDRSEDWAVLYRMAARAAKAHPDAAEVVTVTGDQTAAQMLAAVGFVPRGQVALRFWIPKTDPPAEVRYQMLDNDAAYLHDGSVVFWT